MKRYLACGVLLLLARPVLCQSTHLGPQDSIMRSLRASSDTAALTIAFLRAARFARDSAIYAAAVEIATDASASPEARAASLGVLYIYEKPGFYMPFGDLASGACTSYGIWVDNIPLTGTPLPEGYLEENRQLAMALEDPSAPAIVRNATKCILLSAERRDLMAPVDVSLIQLVYLCGNRFTIRNGNPRVVTVGYRVVGTSEQWNEQGVMARPEGQAYGERVIETQNAGTVELLYEGQVIQTANNGDTECPPHEE